LMATVESSDMVVVAELGVPLATHVSVRERQSSCSVRGMPYGTSGVPGSEGAGGRLMSVGGFAVIMGRFGGLLVSGGGRCERF